MKTMKGKRGAPYGNINALMTGQYLRPLSPEALDYINTELGGDPSEEIARIRERIRRVFFYASDHEAEGVDYIAVTNLIGREVGRLEHLVSLQVRLRRNGKL